MYTSFGGKLNSLAEAPSTKADCLQITKAAWPHTKATSQRLCLTGARASLI